MAALARVVLGASATFLAVAPALADSVVLPLGLHVDLNETITEARQNGADMRFRYVAAEFVPSEITPEAALDDMTFLCQNNALPKIRAPEQDVTIIISLADRAAPFGVMDSSVAQIFEVFSVVDNACIWEAF